MNKGINKREREIVIRALYGAAMGPCSWSAAMGRLAHYTGSRFVSLVITDPTRDSADFTAALQKCYQMTATEADLVNALLTGGSLRDYADEHKITYETARTHLKNAMRKNGWRRQGEMIVQILAHPCPAAEFVSS